MRGVSHDDKGNHICHDCGYTWKGGERWLLWPIRLSLSKVFGFGRHGVETAPDGFYRRNFVTVLSFGWLRIVMGRGYKPKAKWNVEHQCWMPQSDFVQVEEKIDKYLEQITQ